MYHQIRWTARKIAHRIELIEPLVYRRQRQLLPFRYMELESPLAVPPVGDDVDDSSWPVVSVGDCWGNWRTNFVMRTRFQVPDEWTGGVPIGLYLPLGNAGDFSHPEAMVHIDGPPYAACDRHHQEVLLPDALRDGKDHLLALHGWTGLGGGMEGRPSAKLVMRQCSVVQIDQPTRDFVAAARVALGVANELHDDDPARHRLLNALDEAFRLLDTREPLGDRFYESVPAAHEALRRGIEEAGAPMDVGIVAVGHAHLDVAWLWTLDQARHKAARTFYNAVRLMEKFPDFRFTQSQPQLYEFVRRDHPGLFQQIKALVAEGRWEPTGATWVEMDCNITSPESLVRQFLLGQDFFRRYFGSESTVLWLPDSFGFTWSLPQLMKQAGVSYLMTTKLGWNQYNRFPYDTFWWQGIDGSRVLTHFICTPSNADWVSTYHAQATPGEVIGTWRQFQQKELRQDLLLAFGYGDGGGGPTREMLENLDLLREFPSMPRVRQGSAGDFFRTLEAQVGAELPVWNGELYLEYHRGTYTTQSRNKRANRKAEFALHDAEFLAAVASILDQGYGYPERELRESWRTVCLNQFHDIIPGSSIGEVYEESLRQYREVQKRVSSVREAAERVIAGFVGGDLIVVNPISFSRSDLAFWQGELPPDKFLSLPDGTPIPVQPAHGGVWIDAGELPPFNATPLSFGDGRPPRPETGLTVSPYHLENRYLRVELDEAGDIVCIYDKVNRRELLPPGTVANQFQAFEDRPLNFDAWDIDVFFEDKMWTPEPVMEVEVVESGPLRATILIRRRILGSEYTQRISLSHNSPRLDFDTVIDWRERHILLKVAFPVDVLSPVATYEIQWGNIERPTHRNTSWDWARFEVPAQKWVDLSEGDYGVSLLNDCKYGHDVHGNVLRLTLLRSPTMPDPEADSGEHRFSYSLFPHAGRWDHRTVREAYALNDPLLVIHGGGRKPSGAVSWFWLDRPGIAIETVKRAEDGNGIIVRLYEYLRSRGTATLYTGFDIDGAWRTNLLEEDARRLKHGAREVSFQVKPYEIITLRLLPRRRPARFSSEAR